MKKISKLTKAVILSVIGVSFLTLKSNSQTFTNSLGEAFNLTDTITKYDNDADYVVDTRSSKFGMAYDPSGHQHTVSIKIRGGVEPEIRLKFNDEKNNKGKYVVETGYFSYETISFEDYNKDSLFCTITEKFYGYRPSANPDGYPTETRSFTEKRKTNSELVYDDELGKIHVNFTYNEKGTAYDEVTYSMISSDGFKITMKDSFYDKKLDYYSISPATEETKGKYGTVVLKNSAEIEQATREKTGTTKEEIYEIRDYFESVRFCSFSQDLHKSINALNK